MILKKIKKLLVTPLKPNKNTDEFTQILSNHQNLHYNKINFKSKLLLILTMHIFRKVLLKEKQSLCYIIMFDQVTWRMKMRS